MFDKFNNNISDELLAAYLDGNTTKEETEQILEAMSFDESLKEFMDIMEGLEDLDILDREETSISPLTIGGLGVIAGGVSNHLLHGNLRPVAAANMIDIEEINHVDNKSKIMSGLEIESIGEIKEEDVHIHSHNYYEANKQYGLEAKNIDFDPNTYQFESDTCAIRSQEIVLRDYGIFVSQDELKDIAIQNDWYAKGGTPFEAVGNLLDYHDVPNHREYNANVFNIADELAQGHRVIVGVDANELGGNSFWQTIKEFFVGDTPNHALIVSGLDTSDPNNIKVILTDPGTGKTLFECPQDRFIAAWEDSKCYMVATDQPAPLAYNGNTMVGFDYDKGHIAAIGNIDYDQFHNEIVPDAERLLPYLNLLDEYINNLELNIATDWEYPELYNQLDDLTNSCHDEYIKLKMQNLAGINDVVINEEDKDDGCAQNINNEDDVIFQGHNSIIPSTTEDYNDDNDDDYSDNEIDINN